MRFPRKGWWSLTRNAAENGFFAFYRQGANDTATRGMSSQHPIQRLPAEINPARYPACLRATGVVKATKLKQAP
jgi:hypothetical protein